MVQPTNKVPLSIIVAAGMLLACPAGASTLRISAGAADRASGEVDTTSHLFVDEGAGQNVPITIFFDPQTLGVASAEVFTNLNRRDLATATPNGDGIPEGIKPPPGNGI